MEKDLSNISYGMTHIEADRRERIDVFAKYVAVLPWFNIYILHKLYINFFETREILALDQSERESFEMRAITCADFLQASPVERIDYNVFVLQEAYKDYWVQKVQANEELFSQLGKFMLAYAESNQSHFLSLKYWSVFRVGGAIMVDPKLAVTSISRHVIDQLNKSHYSGQTQEKITYYLSIFDQEGRKQKFKDLIAFMEALIDIEDGRTDSAVKRLKELSKPLKSEDGSFPIKLPISIKNKVVELLEQEKMEEALNTVSKATCLIKSKNRILGNGVLISKDYILTLYQIIPSKEVAEEARVTFIEGEDFTKKTFRLDPSIFFEKNEDLNYSIIKIKASETDSMMDINSVKLGIAPKLKGTNIGLAFFSMGEEITLKIGLVNDSSKDYFSLEEEYSEEAIGAPIFDFKGLLIGLKMGVKYNSVGLEEVGLINGKSSALWLSSIREDLKNRGYHLDYIIPKTFRIANPQLHALLVGVATNRYNTNALQGCENDLKAIQNCLDGLAAGYFRNPQFHILLNEEATRQNVVQAFETHLINQAQKGDVVVFYFSGHGGQEIAPKRLKTHDGKLPGIVCYDSNIKGSPKLISLEFRFLIYLLSLKECQIITIFDCAHAGTITGNGISKDWKNPFDDNLDSLMKNIGSDLKAKRGDPTIPPRFWSEMLVHPDHPLKDLSIMGSKDLSEILPEGNHISISASLDFEQCFENPNLEIGYFTQALVGTLNESKGAISYLQLQQKVRHQLRKSLFDPPPTPNIYTPQGYEEALLNNFLYGDKRDHPLYGNILFNGEKWIIDLGGLHGMVAEPKSDRTSIHVITGEDSFEIAYISRVYVDHSEIVWACVEQEAERKIHAPKSEPINCYIALKQDARYRGYISGLMSHPLKLFLGGEDAGIDLLKEGMQVFEKEYPEFSLDVVNEPTDSFYQVIAQEGTYHLVQSHDLKSVVKHVAEYTEASAKQVCQDLLAISRWTFVKHLNNKVGGWHEPFPIQMILEQESGETHFLTRKDHRIRLDHSKTDFIKFRIRYVNQSDSDLFFGLLYLDQEFGVHTNFLSPKVVKLENRRSEFNDVSVSQGHWVKLRLPEHVKMLNWPEEVVYFKMIISSKPFSIDLFKQESLSAPDLNFRYDRTNSSSRKGEIIDSNQGEIYPLSKFPKNESKNNNSGFEGFGFNIPISEDFGYDWTTHLIEFRLRNPFYGENFSEKVEFVLNHQMEVYQTVKFDKKIGKGEEILEALLIFSSENKNLWLLTTDQFLYIFQDDHKSREKGNSVKAKVDLKKLIGRIKIETSRKGEGVFMIENLKQQWPYSRKLFNGKGVFLNSITSLINRALDWKRISSSVGRIYLDNGTQCNGLLLRGGYILLTHHVFEIGNTGKEAKDIISKSYIEFSQESLENYEKIRFQFDKSFYLFSSVPYKLDDQDFEQIPKDGMMDYVLLKLKFDNPTDLADLTYLNLGKKRATEAGETIFLMRTPEENIQQFRLQNNQTTHSNWRHYLYYDAETGMGSSGSPILNDKLDVIGLHQYSMQNKGSMLVNEKEERASVGRGTLISYIIEDIENKAESEGLKFEFIEQYI